MSRLLMCVVWWLQALADLEERTEAKGGTRLPVGDTTAVYKETDSRKGLFVNSDLMLQSHGRPPELQRVNRGCCCAGPDTMGGSGDSLPLWTPT